MTPTPTPKFDRKTALIIVDVQRDFLPGGALAVPDGDHVIPAIREIDAELNAGRLENDPWLTFASRDYHPANHVSFAKGEPEYRDGSWPVHCVAGTDGARMDPAIRRLIGGRIGRTVSKGTDPDAEAYSAFAGVTGFGKPLEAALREYGIERVIVCGLALDYCVKATALDAAERGFSVSVPVRATKAVTERGAEEALYELAASGVELT